MVVTSWIRVFKISNKTDNSDSNKTDNGDSNKKDNGDSNKTDNGDRNKTDNSDSNKKDNGDSNKIDNGDSNKTDNSDSNKTDNGELKMRKQKFKTVDPARPSALVGYLEILRGDLDPFLHSNCSNHFGIWFSILPFHSIT